MSSHNDSETYKELEAEYEEANKASLTALEALGKLPAAAEHAEYVKSYISKLEAIQAEYKSAGQKLEAAIGGRMVVDEAYLTPRDTQPWSKADRHQHFTDQQKTDYALHQLFLNDIADVIVHAQAIIKTGGANAALELSKIAVTLRTDAYNEWSSSNGRALEARSLFERSRAFDIALVLPALSPTLVENKDEFVDWVGVIASFISDSEDSLTRSQQAYTKEGNRAALTLVNKNLSEIGHIPTVLTALLQKAEQLEAYSAKSKPAYAKLGNDIYDTLNARFPVEIKAVAARTNQRYRTK